MITKWKNEFTMNDVNGFLYLEMCRELLYKTRPLERAQKAFFMNGATLSAIERAVPPDVFFLPPPRPITLFDVRIVTRDILPTGMVCLAWDMATDDELLEMCK